VTSGSVASNKQLGDDLQAEHYENIAAVRSREAEIAAAIARLASLSAKKRPVLDDDLAREKFRAKLAMQNQNHKAQAAALEAWVHEKSAYLNTVDHIDTVEGAETALNLLETFEQEKATAHSTRFAALVALGKEILNARYSTQYSSAQWETPAEVTERENVWQNTRRHSLTISHSLTSSLTNIVGLGAQLLGHVDRAVGC